MPVSKIARMLGARAQRRPSSPARSEHADRVGRDRVGQDFDRHIAAEPRVARRYLAHSTGAKGRNDLMRAKACAGRSFNALNYMGGLERAVDYSSTPIR